MKAGSLQFREEKNEENYDRCYQVSKSLDQLSTNRIGNILLKNQGLDLNKYNSVLGTVGNELQLAATRQQGSRHYQKFKKMGKTKL